MSGVAGAVDRQRLVALLGDEALAWLVARCRQRLARGQPLAGTVTLSNASPAQRQAAARLLGRPPGRGSSLTVPLQRVAELLADAGVAPDLTTAVQALCGPVADARSAAGDHERRWAQVYDDAAKRLGGRLGDRPALGEWVARLRGDGLLRRLAGDDPRAGRQLLDAAVTVVGALPAGGTSRSVLAAATLGDGHALDDGRPVATLVVRAIEALVPGAPADRREAWAAVGVAADPLTSQVMALGVPGDAASTTGRVLATLAGAGEPATLTLRQLVGDPPWPPVAGTTVSVCENVSVLTAAADRLGADAAPLVCTDGQPSTAVRLLLDRLVACGARLRVHADFDWAGLRIAGGVMARTGAAPWRMGSCDYIAAVARSRKPLVGTATAASWDDELTPALHAHGLAVEEELVLDELLGDLS